MVMAIHEADGQDVTMQEEIAYSLVAGGGKPGQGYPCIMVVDDGSRVLCGRVGKDERHRVSGGMLSIPEGGGDSHGGDGK